MEFTPSLFLSDGDESSREAKNDSVKNAFKEELLYLSGDSVERPRA